MISTALLVPVLFICLVAMVKRKRSFDLWFFSWFFFILIFLNFFYTEYRGKNFKLELESKSTSRKRNSMEFNWFARWNTNVHAHTQVSHEKSASTSHRTIRRKQFHPESNSSNWSSNAEPNWNSSNSNSKPSTDSSSICTIREDRTGKGKANFKTNIRFIRFTWIWIAKHRRVFTSCANVSANRENIRYAKYGARRTGIFNIIIVPAETIQWNIFCENDNMWNCVNKIM